MSPVSFNNFLLFFAALSIKLSAEQSSSKDELPQNVKYKRTPTSNVVVNQKTNTNKAMERKRRRWDY